jgi:ribose-phosphate pyrophosphokinase
MPYYGYARQDRKVQPRAPISAKLVADLLTSAGTDRVLCVDLHAGQIQGFFNIPVDNLYATPILLDAIKTRFSGDLAIISPDAGGVERARAYAKPRVASSERGRMRSDSTRASRSSTSGATDRTSPR